jgi:hypothetical protein
MAAGSGSHGWRRSGVLRPWKTAERAQPDTARLPAVFIFLRSIPTPANRAWSAAARLPVAAQAVDAARPLGRGRRQGIGCGADLNRVRAPRFPGRAKVPRAQMGPTRADGWAGADLGRAFGLGPVR